MKNAVEKAPDHLSSSSSLDLEQRLPSTNYQPGLYSWPKCFCSRREISRSWENSPWIRAVWRFANEVADDLEDEEDLLFFLKSEENWVPDRHHLDAILNLFRGETLKKLRDGNNSIPNDKIALLIDGNYSDEGIRLRPFLGGLSAKQLFDELIKKVVLCIEEDFNKVKATEGPETFSLEFSLPFRAWRTMNRSKHDSRIRNTDEEPLRLSRDVTFLRTLANDHSRTALVDVVYSSQISCIITGFDEHRWTAIVLVETWFEDNTLDDPTPDEIIRYETDFNDGMLLDPLVRGKDDSTRTTWLPRCYFIRIMEVRLRQVYLEWKTLQTELSRIIRAIVSR
ncbi:hypothetical protein CI238_06516 [Colletotrichum incanum]|uniref:Uncharacterized protein n=1 Tax=Colletotrichum incanum TaxID=1573173 RepID=A0A161WFA7_COLIC|nr:hypothetical protein CI238_06516 [Colletotrichum incanum]